MKSEPNSTAANSDPIDQKGDIDAGRKVLEIEADALRKMAEELDDTFVTALNLLSPPQGRVIVTGMGKSGHVARKIAATMASTGMPAFYVHPGEASHGDLGMITEKDAILALSNSGETAELADIIAYSRRFNIPLVAITREADSLLARSADATLVLPEVPEACPMGLAPTTSTTASLALGDAIAVALLERIGFTASDFQQLHPGGRLGDRLKKVSDLMHKGDEIPLIEPFAPMSEALLAMTQKSLGCVGIRDKEGLLLGIITDGDLRRHMSEGLLAKTAGELMTVNPITISPDMLASEALGIMNERSITNLFVAENGQPVGVVHIHDFLRAGIA
ncbi:SIS domain-containing protein [Magnetospira sp. QH-2]|uniref:KpsF/GutQ family sugar-phosphate isomerase n=1 Tax=Magnetospira sp. (strain QH-2) TaxID=1288970 RepID=UPI0003E80FE7|nr:KpsF/GutQ family sugar-phosphate isomerase [Magnetospira sp. QH-2]CCQ74680.1 Arabinose 5-phosphate isomerase [Magnetospira sp. QH-2]